MPSFYMSIKVLGNITHNSVEYSNGDIVTDITREESQRLIDLNMAIKIDDKFKLPREITKKNMAMVRNRRKGQMLWYSRSR